MLVAATGLRIPPGTLWFAMVVAVLGVTILPAQIARAGQCGVGCSTVCEDGSCDFISPHTCTTATATGGVCLIRGGTYHETIDANGSCPGTCPTGVVIRCEDPVLDPCVIDGDVVRDNGIVGYSGWVVEGLEIRNTLRDAITSIPSREIGEVRDCYIHDVGGMGIGLVASTNGNRDVIVERNRVEHTGAAGIQCSPGPTLRYHVRNNLVVEAALTSSYPISCSTISATVSHNTVVQRERADVTYGISAQIARFNLVVGGVTSINSTVESSYNLAAGWTTAAYGGAGAQTGNLTTSDPLFVNRDDLHLQAGSPAIDQAATSTTATDFDGATRSGTPDIGALEYAAGHIPVAEAWPVRETISNLTTGLAAPSLGYWPGVGPVAVYFENRGASGDLVFARRLTDGTWTREVVRTINIQSSSGMYNRSTDLAVDPATGRPAVVWVEQTGTNRALRFARNVGGCRNGDCLSPYWTGCTSSVLFPNTDVFSVALAFHPTAFYPAVVTVQLSTSGYYSVYYWDQSNGTWRGKNIEMGLTANYLGWGVDLSFNPATGAPEIVYARVAKTGTPPTRALVHATGDVVNGFVVTALPLGGDTGPHATNQYNRVAIAHDASGDLAVAFSGSQIASPLFGTFFFERVGGGWMSALPVDAQAAVGPTYDGLDLLHDVDGSLLVAESHDARLRLARREADEWSYSFLDVATPTGLFADAELGENGNLMLSYQRNTAAPKTILFRAAGDPGGEAPATPAPTSCTDTDLCTVDTCSATLGCVHSPVGCDDSDLCTADSCNPGTGGCVHQPVGCDDADACTVDACEPGTGCTHAPRNCSDGDRCSVDSCDPVTGCENVPVDCDDSNACTADACDGMTGACTHPAISCDDGENCTADSCDTRDGCLHQTITCDDGDLCTDDSCTLIGECRHAPKDCDDGNACTVDSCSSSTGACRNIALVCDDAEFCTDDSCDTVLGCQFTDNILSCDDSDPDTIADTCLAGTCSGVPAQVAIPAIVETIAVSDAPRVVPPASISVVETIAVSDTPNVIPPARISIVETIAVQDSPTVVGGLLPDGGLPDASALDVELPDQGSHDRATRTDASTDQDAVFRDSSAVSDAASGRDAGNARVDPPPDDEETGCGGLGCRAATPTPSLLTVLIALAALVRRRRRGR